MNENSVFLKVDSNSFGHFIAGNYIRVRDNEVLFDMEKGRVQLKRYLIIPLEELEEHLTRIYEWRDYIRGVLPEGSAE